MAGDRDHSQLECDGEIGENIPLRTATEIGDGEIKQDEGERNRLNGVKEEDLGPITKGVDNVSRINRIFNTISIYAAMLSLGLVASCLGPALTDLEEVFYTDTKTIVVVFTCTSVGYLTGTLLTGYLVSKLSDSFFFLVAAVAMSVALTVSVWIRNLVVWCGFMALANTFGGGVDCVGQVSILHLWQGSKYKDSVLQGIHFTWSVGATIAPFIVEPFLSSDHARNNVTEFDGNSTDLVNVNLTGDTEETTYSFVTNGNFTDLPSEELITRVQYGILTIGLLSLSLSIFCFIAFALDGWKIRKKKSETHHEEHRQSQTKLFKVITIIGVIILYFFYICCEQTTGNLLATFVVEGLHWEKFKGPLITSVFWGVFGVARLVGIVLSKIFTPVQLMYVDSVLICVGFALMVAMIHVHESVTWVGMALVGLGLGSFFAAGFSFIDQYLTVDGLISASILGASSVSAMTTIPLTGYIFAVYGPMSMIYILFTSSLLVLVTFIGLHVFTKWYGKKHLNSVPVVEKHVNEEDGSCEAVGV